MEDLDIGAFWASPRHACYFEHSIGTLLPKISARLGQLREHGKIEDKKPIINIQQSPDIVEVHDGNLSMLIWMVWARAKAIDPVLSAFRRSFPQTVMLNNRRHPSGDIWHPFVPPEVGCAAQLGEAVDFEQGRRRVRKAVTHGGTPVYFNDTRYFSGIDASVQFRDLADRMGAAGLLVNFK